MDAKDIGKKVENPVLLEAMKKLRENENSETLRAFFGAVVHAVFVVPATFDKDPVVTADGKQTLEQGVKINFALLTNGNGEKVLPCFTDEDVLFFDTSKFLVEKAKQEDFIVMGRFADAILTNNHIPHISIFITAPEKRRVQRFLEINKNVTPNQAKKWIESEDKRHLKTYKFYTGRKWSKASNYDICINSASYGIKGSIELIIRMLQLDDRVKQLIK